MPEISTQHAAANEVLVQVRLSMNDYEPEVAKKIKKYSQNADIKGFRKGHVPFSHIDRLYGARIRAEVVQAVSERQLSAYIERQSWNLLGQPLLEPIEAPIDFTKPEVVSLTYRLGLRPEFTLEPIEKKPFVRLGVRVDDKSMAQLIRELRYRFGNVVEAQRAGQTEEEVLYGVLAPEDDKKVSIFLRYSSLNTAGKKVFKGLNVGEQVLLNFGRGLFKKDEEAKSLWMRMERQGMDPKGKYTFQLDKLDQLTQAPLSKPFFQKVLGDDTIENEDAFKEKLRLYLEKRYEERAEGLLKNQIVERALATVKIELPEDYLKQQLAALTQKAIPDTKSKDKSALDVYKNDLKWRLIQQKAIHMIGSDITAKDIEEAAIVSMAQQMRLPAQPNPAQKQACLEATQKWLQNEQNRARVYDYLREQKTFTYLLGRIKIKTQSIKSSDFDAKYPEKTH